MQLPHFPPHAQERSGPSAGIRLAVSCTVAAAVGGYALALGLTGIPVLIAAVLGSVGGLILAGALAD